MSISVPTLCVRVCICVYLEFYGSGMSLGSLGELALMTF